MPRAASVPMPVKTSCLRRRWCFVLRIPQSRITSASPKVYFFFWWMILSLAILRVNTDCWYENERHPEGVQVLTNEPCLNCTCSRGALLCYLRVCPRLPNPPPPGCILLHRFKSCCQELICSDIPSGNSIEGRSEIDPTEEFLSQESLENSIDMKNACVFNGSIYAPGSAMDSSTNCEYCYCIGGKQKCVRPKCLLPLDGCAPAYDADDCCPARYNCTKDLFTTTSTTTLAPKEFDAHGGCIVDGEFYPEGGKVLGIGHSACDNCYCLRGLVRCEPLSCASPLLGCTPVIKTGECCAASYNCSGAIETQPEPNYGQFPTVSKEYAKLRKEVQHKRTTTQNKTPPPMVKTVPYYVIAESTKASAPDWPEIKSSGVLTQSPFYYNFTGSKEETRSADKTTSPEREKQQHPEIYYVPTKVTGSNLNPDIYREDALATTIRHKKYTSSTEVKQVQNLLLEERIIRGITNKTDTEGPELSETTTLAETTITTSIPITTTTEIEEVTSSTTLLNDFATQTETTTGTNLDFELSTVTTTQTEEMEETKDDYNNEKTKEEAEQKNVTEENESSTPFMQLVELITMRTVSNSTDCITMNSSEVSIDLQQNENRHAVDIDYDDNLENGNSTTTTEFGTTTIEITESTITNSESTTELQNDNENKQNTATLPPNTKFALQNILNVNKSSSDYDYDYNAPTLPPSLPNLRIIPFVAADAVDSKNENLKTSNHLYLEEKNFPFNNQFSPPAETEGGFVPKEPPAILIDGFYEDYHTTNLKGNTGATIMPPIPALTNPPKTNENNCMIDTKEVKHGESVTSEGNCALCVCFYGSIVCHEPQCAIPQLGCRNSNKIDRSTCCPEIICDIDESPTVVIDSKDNSSKSNIKVADPVTPADPFKDVIRTEPAPDLQLLIGDMSNYLLKQSTTTTKASLSPENSTELPILITTQSEENDLSFNKIWDMLFNNHDDSNFRNAQSSTTSTSTTLTTPSTIPTTKSIKNSSTNSEINSERDHNFLETRENVDNPLTNNLSWMGSISKRQEHVPSLLKLAGCNIYGRMYRVGRIISELSGPCMECKCTEVGVQCENLTC